MCTRMLFTGEQNTVITARSMDWNEDLLSDLWAFPRGLQRTSPGSEKSVSWVSKYGSVITSAYNAASADGMNEKGLNVCLLYLAESQYGGPDDRPVLSIAMWPQYVLDNFGSVAHAVASLQKDSFRIGPFTTPNGRPASMHLAVADPTGDSAIIEYVYGEVVIDHGRQYQVMTNSPVFDQQLALNAYWRRIGGMTFMPGTISAADRFVRVSFFNDALPKSVDKNYINGVPGKSFAHQALASTLGAIRAVGVPLGIASPTEPNISSTIWRTLSDHKNGVYYFDSALSPCVCWVDLKKLDFQTGQPPKKLALANGVIQSGETSEKFVKAQPFEFFMPAN